VLGGGAAFAAVEKDQDMSAWDGAWWAVTTVTTVGYGDFSPKTDGGRVIATFVMVIGIGFVALLTAAAAERFIRRSEDPRAVDARLEEVSARLGAIERRLRDQP
jgi:voltage-gated potassium channel